MNRSSTILLVEDEINLAKTLILNLKAEGYKTFLAGSGKEVALILNTELASLDLVILDVMLPDSTGFDLCRKIKSQRSELPVIFLTAKSQGMDKIEGLKLGADDYITKPFDLEELLLRIRNVLKRTRKSSSRKYTFSNGSIDFNTFEITTVNGETITLSKREIGLLELLTAHANEVISRDRIIDLLWNENESPSSRTIDNYILNFRKYFEKDPKNPEHFFSVRGVGYKFVA